VVKVIRQKAASLPHMDGAVVFNRLQQYAAPTKNTCFHGPTQVPDPIWHLSRLSRFCTAHDRTSLYFTMDRPSPSDWQTDHTILGL